MDVAIIDTGIDPHPDLNVVQRTDCAWDVIGGLFGLPTTCHDGEGVDGNGHGTHVARTVGALDDGAGVVGVAPGARLHAVKVLDDAGSGYISWVVAGIDWDTARAGVIEVANMSLTCACASAALDQAIAASARWGVVYAVAAGNDADDAGGYSPPTTPT